MAGPVPHGAGSYQGVLRERGRAGETESPAKPGFPCTTCFHPGPPPPRWRDEGGGVTHASCATSILPARSVYSGMRSKFR